MTQPQPQQQLNLHPVQALQIADMVLRELEIYCDKKAALPLWSHPHEEMQAKKSLFHSRLILGLRIKELVQELQGAPGYAKSQSLATAYNSKTPHREPAPDLDLKDYTEVHRAVYGPQPSLGSN